MKCVINFGTIFFLQKNNLLWNGGSMLITNLHDKSSSFDCKKVKVSLIQMFNDD